MNALADLIDDARNAQRQGAQGALPGAEAEADRMLQICNACRYCEGFCAVFPAMTRRLTFASADIHYLANLCHNCSACYQACQYAPPHEFAVNIPRVLAQVRRTTYIDYAWPASIASLYRRRSACAAVVIGILCTLFLGLLSVSFHAPAFAPLAGNFYAVLPHETLITVFGIVFLCACFALGKGVSRFWRAIGPAAHMSAGAAIEAAGDVFTLKYLGGGQGQGCNESDDRFTLWRRRFHHLTFYGFLMCFASTSVATIYHYVFAWYAPYPINSLPVVLGIVGGAGLVLGPLGLLGLSQRRALEHADLEQVPLDRGFSVLLLLIAATGLGLMLARDSRFMTLLLIIHLGVVLALFVTMPYGKFAHGVYRTATLLKFAIERRLKSNLGVD